MATISIEEYDGRPIDEFQLRGFTVREMWNCYEIGYYALTDIFVVEQRRATFRGVAYWIDQQHKQLNRVKGA